MPQQHPGRLQVLVVDTHCENASCFQRKHRQIPMSLPDASARRITALWWYYATTDFCSASERAPGSHCRWRKGSRSRHQHLQDWLS